MPSNTFVYSHEKKSQHIMYTDPDIYDIQKWMTTPVMFTFLTWIVSSQTWIISIVFIQLNNLRNMEQ